VYPNGKQREDGMVSTTYRPMVHSQGSTEYHLGHREKSQNKYINILKYHKQFPITLQLSEEFLPRNWQYCSTLYVVKTTSSIFYPVNVFMGSIS
jgi:hypothetical protein